jgi:hypothetical protein
MLVRSRRAMTFAVGTALIALAAACTNPAAPHDGGVTVGGGSHLSPSGVTVGGGTHTQTASGVTVGGGT